MRNGERGSATLGVLLVTGLLGASLVALGSVTVLYGARVEAGNAADAAALAAAVASYPPVGAEAPIAEAERLAAANGARLVRCVCPVDPTLSTRVAEVLVETEVSVPFFGALGVRAAARAEFDPMAWLGP